MERVSTYLPLDRRQALAASRSLPERAEGAALCADVVGLTRLTDKLVVRLGARRGAEELLRLLNAVYDPLIAQVHCYGGSVVGLNGAGFNCWFDDSAPGPGSLRATACGQCVGHRRLSGRCLPSYPRCAAGDEGTRARAGRSFPRVHHPPDV
jgi:class 3 adenylate cyclase